MLAKLLLIVASYHSNRNPKTISVYLCLEFASDTYHLLKPLVGFLIVTEVITETHFFYIKTFELNIKLTVACVHTHALCCLMVKRRYWKARDIIGRVGMCSFYTVCCCILTWDDDTAGDIFFCWLIVFLVMSTPLQKHLASKSFL